MSLEEKRRLVCPSYKKMSVYRQCKVMDLPRISYYFKSKGESLFNLQVMNAIGRKFLDCPFYGVERMTEYLRQDLGYLVWYKRVRRLYKLMNLKTIHPKKNLSKANKADYKFPYLLRNLKIERPAQVWQADITYIPMYKGFMYMFAIIDVSTYYYDHNGLLKSEWRAVYRENIIRGQAGIALRTHYGYDISTGVPLPIGPRLLTPANLPINYR